MRKTVNIKSLIEMVNKYNATSVDAYKDQREGQSMLLEQVLLDADAYAGFAYLSKHELQGYAMSVGVREQNPNGTWNFDDTDHTRVKYFIDAKL